MNTMTLLLIGAVLYTPFSGLAAETAPVKALDTTLEELGYPTGLTFDGSSQPSERALMFHLPNGMAVTSAALTIVYRGSPRLSRGAALSVVINELPPQRMELIADKETREWRVTVPASELKSGQLKVTLGGYIPVDYGNVLDGEPQSGFVHIAAETRMEAIVAGKPVTLRDAWLTLPDEVVVSIPRGELKEATFRTALDWVILLQRNHHRVSVTTLPHLGDLVIAPETDIITAVESGSSHASDVHTLWGEADGTVGIVEHKDKAIIAVIAPDADIESFAAKWNKMDQPVYLKKEYATAADPIESIPLSELGMSTSPAMLGHKVQWTATITPWNLPPGSRPRTATIFLALPAIPQSKVLRLFIYLNDRMVVSKRLAADGQSREIVIPFEAAAYADAYQLRVVVRDGGDEYNERARSFYPVAIMPGSHITLDWEPPGEVGFSSLPTALGQGFDLYLPREYLAKAPLYMGRIGNLFTGFVVPATDYKIVVIEPGHVASPRRSFMVAGETPPFVGNMPLRFDEGRVQLVNYRGDRVVGEQRLRTADVVQIVDVEDVSGIWFRPGELDEVPAIDANMLGKDNVAIYEPGQLTLSMNSQQMDLVRPQYQEKPGWGERLYKQRVLWLQIGWGVLTIFVLYLYMKSRQHRKG